MGVRAEVQNDIRTCQLTSRSHLPGVRSHGVGVLRQRLANADALVNDGQLLKKGRGGLLLHFVV